MWGLWTPDPHNWLVLGKITHNNLHTYVELCECKDDPGLPKRIQVEICFKTVLISTHWHWMDS